MAKKCLGKGLDILLGGSNADDIVSPAVKLEAGDNIISLKLVDIEPNRSQPRKDFDEDSLNELADSIKENGVISPIIVKKAENGFYTIVAGERRWRASKKAGLKEIPAIIRELTEIETRKIALIENLQRQDLNLVEEALGYRELMDEHSLTQEQVATMMGKSRSSVANSLRLLSLSPDVLSLVRDGSISFGHAKVIMGCDAKKQGEIAKQIIDGDLSVRQTEDLLKQKSTKKPTGAKKDLNMTLALKEIEKGISSILGANVKIKDKGNKGTVSVEYYSSEELERIVNILSGKK